MSNATLSIDGDNYTVSCEHKTYTTTRTNDPQTIETEEIMIRTALQRHSSYCEQPCTIDLWLEWFRRLRVRCEEDQKIKGSSLLAR
jgi:hypothetical protein